MILAVDVGNSDITIGLWMNNNWDHVWRIPTSIEQQELFYGLVLKENFLEAGVSIYNVETVILSSVVPGITDKIQHVLTTLFSKETILLGPSVYSSLAIQINNPFEIGSDLVANAVAAHRKFGEDCVIVDFGTALTFTTVYKSVIAGVAIVPGLKTAIKSLSQNAAKLYEVPLEVPQSVLGRSTVHAIQAGILVGYEGLVKNIITKIRAELNNPQIPVVATGGLSSIITTLKDTFDDINPHLTLDGLRIIATGS